MASIEIAIAVTSVVDSARSIRPPASAAPIITKPNSPPGPSSSAISALTRARQPEGAGQSEQDHDLDSDEGGGETEDQAGPGDDQSRIDPGPDRDEIEPEQQALERLDRHLDLAAVLGLRQQEPGDEGAERHRQVARRGEQAVAEHDQETGGHEELGAPGLGDEMEERPQRQPAERDQVRQRQRCRHERLDQRQSEIHGRRRRKRRTP